MKTLEKLTFLSLIGLGIILLGCQKKEAYELDPPIIEEEEEVSNTPAKDTTTYEVVEEGNPLPGQSEETQEHKRCNSNFIIVNKMLRKIIIETYVQSTIIGMPGFHGGNEGSRVDCPDATLTDYASYPTTLTLDYGTGCSPATGLEVAGILEVDFSGPIEDEGTEITVRPQDDFAISGFDVDVSADNAFTLTSIASGIFSPAFADGESISVTDPDGQVTSAGSINSENSILSYDDNGTNDDPTDILDDTFTFYFEDLIVDCGNGSSLTMVSEEELVYDLTCDCIQDGIVNSYDERVLVQTTDFGYPAVDDEEGVCDDEILIITEFSERSSSTEEVITCP